MSVQFQDYYHTLGVKRDASAQDIQKAFRKLARKYHPDLNKDAHAEAKFKQINEANEVLSDPEKRKRYDTLGSNYKNGQTFQPPPEWADIFAGFSGASGRGFNFNTKNTQAGDTQGGFSDFFNILFGKSDLFGQGDIFSKSYTQAQTGQAGYGCGQGPCGNSFGKSPFENAGAQSFSRDGDSVKASVTVPITDAYRGAMRSVTLSFKDELGRQEKRSYQVKIPAGVVDGSVIRLRGQGSKGSLGGRDGDLLLSIKIAHHPVFKLIDRDVHTTLKISPWEAVLGTKVSVETLDGEVSLSVPKGAQSGQKLRLRGKGFLSQTDTKGGKPSESGNADVMEDRKGDQIVTLQIVVPQHLSEKEKHLFEELQTHSTFNPRRIES